MVGDFFFPTKTERPSETGENAGDYDCWTVYTECRANINGEVKLLHAHPNYKNEGAFYDWVMLDYSTANQRRNRKLEQHGYYEGMFPGKVLGFINQREGNKDEICALVHTCDVRDATETHLRDTVLTSEWRMEYKVGTVRRKEGGAFRTVKKNIPIVRKVPLISIGARCLVIEEHRDVSEARPCSECGKDYDRVTLLKPAELWPGEFF